MSSVTLAAVGDIMLGDSPQVFGYGVGSQIRRHGVQHPLAHVRERLAAADITVGNLEVAISGFDPAHTDFGDQIYRGQPAAIAGLAEAGFDVVSVCTNHMMQHGQAALDETLDSVRAAGIEAIGAMRTGESAPRVATLVREGLRFTFLAYNFRPQQYFVAPPAWPTPDLDLIRRDIAARRAATDVMVLALHWGDEFMHEPALHQIGLARHLVDAGADVILGHHPHALQGVERYHGAVIAYSLGNFVYDQWQERLRRSAILALTIRGPRDIDCRVEPVQINALHQPVPVAPGQGDERAAWLRSLDSRIGSLSDAQYREQLRLANRRFRREIYVHYLTQFWRSNPRHFLANIAGIVKRRL